MRICAPVLAIIGLVLLWLTPFSILKNMQIFVVAIVAAGILKIIFKWPVVRIQSVDLAPLAKLKRIRYLLVAVVLYSLIGSFVSILILLFSGEVSVDQLLWRAFSQLGAMCVYMFTIVCGYYMAVYFNSYHIRQAIYVPILLMILICFYQIFSEKFGLPYVGIYAFDKTVGLRPSGLAGEPKFMASYFAVIIFFLLNELRFKINGLAILGNIWKLCEIIVLIYLFSRAASGNGLLAVFILGLVYFAKFKIWQQIVIGTVMAVILFWLGSKMQINEIAMRESHLTIINNISSLNLSMFDDLIALPFMAWSDNLWNLLIGFGPGLMHFFANRYIYYATWLTDETYIEGSVSVITFISNFGLILFAILFVFLSKRSFVLMKNMRSQLEQFSLNQFFVNSFFVGALVQGNTSIPLYLSIGWILCWSMLPSIPERSGNPAII